MENKIIKIIKDSKDLIIDNVAGSDECVIDNNYDWVNYIINSIDSQYGEDYEDYYLGSWNNNIFFENENEAINYVVDKVSKRLKKRKVKK